MNHRSSDERIVFIVDTGPTKIDALRAETTFISVDTRLWNVILGRCGTYR